MMQSERRTGRLPVLVGAFALTIAAALGGCTTASAPAGRNAAEIPLGDWWPAAADAIPAGTSVSRPVAANEALGDWWPSEAAPKPGVTVAASAR